MKKLILVRHAKSSWEEDVIDHERPLNTRGLRDADNVSKALIGFLSPDLIKCSDAVRTRLTANIFIKNLQYGAINFELDHKLYDFSGSNLIEVIKSCDDTIETLMVFGHNHALTAFVNTFGDQYIDNVPTSGVVAIEFNIAHWNNLKPGKTFHTLFPRDLKA